VKMRVFRKPQKSPIVLIKEVCILCSQQFETFSNQAKSDVLEKWKQQCCLAMCKLLQLESLNNCYHFILSDGTFCDVCLELMREVEMSMREVEGLERRVLKSVEAVKIRLTKAAKNTNTELIQETMNKMEQVEDQNLSNWYSMQQTFLKTVICDLLKSSKTYQRVIKHHNRYIPFILSGYIK